jgi:predicted RNA-binding Zn-ribbon protein involved in translation (DUF1610 family)
MFDPKDIRNKAGGGGGAPIRHPAAAICPRCGDVHAVAVATDRPEVHAVTCPTCGVFTWNSAAHRVVGDSDGR